MPAALIIGPVAIEAVAATDVITAVLGVAVMTGFEGGGTNTTGRAVAVTTEAGAVTGVPVGPAEVTVAGTVGGGS